MTDPFHSSTTVDERQKAMRNFTYSQCIDALCFSPCLQPTTIAALAKRMRKLRAEPANQLEEMMNSMCTATKTAHDLGVDCYQMVPKDDNDNPLGIGLILLDPLKATAIVSLLESMPDEEVED